MLSTVFVVPVSQPADSAHQHSLFNAMQVAGVDTVIIEPGATPDSGTVTVSLASLTIKGDSQIDGASLPMYDLNINASQVTLDNLNLGAVTVANAVNHTTVSRSQIFNFVETGAMSGAGNNTLSHNRILGAVDLQGNSGLLQPTTDLIEYNEFLSLQPVVLKITNSNLTTVQYNHLVGDGNSAAGIQVRSNSDSVSIVGNTVEMTGAGNPIALTLINTGGAAGNVLGAKVLNNTLSAGSSGTGLYINIFGTGASMIVQVEGNDVTRNKVGIDINGVPGATGGGNVDVGGGSNAFGTSKGANNFRGFDGVNGHFAINLHNTDAGITVLAHQNIFDNGITPGTVVRDGTNGGGTGSLDVSGFLDPDHAFVQSLYTQLLGRAGDTTAGGEVDQWVAKLAKIGRKGVSKGLLFSDESLSRMVDHVFTDFLDRNADATELAKYTKQLKLTKNIARVEATILGSVEFQTRISSDFVQAVYTDVLDRTATATELASAYKSLPAVGLKGLAAKVTGSQERRTNFAADLISDLLHHNPTPDETTALAKKRGNLLGLELLVLSSDDYYSHG